VPAREFAVAFAASGTNGGDDIGFSHVNAPEFERQ
jgi:hypothetical protein